ncbi:zincin-like metallopeptidase domain-containing protein [Sphingomonas sp.]|uniref:ArdC family protein n=1 Tax=Sphingomonas sp. TaxID=28214 RepID=UPI0028AB932F|nr:zincin-like metallopeptidase domain-containing protein [Sphingomonas sp.]
MGVRNENRASLYAEVTGRVIAELEQGRLPWVQPWDAAACGCAMPANAVTGRRYSGINVLILWAAVIEGRYASQRWLTFRQARAAGGSVRRGERGTTICYADRFTPKDEVERARDEDREARQLAFLKRFTVFNVDQCEGLPERLTVVAQGEPMAEADRIPAAHVLMEACGADIRIGGGEAYYSPKGDYVAVPPQLAFYDRINWYRTVLHELGHWTGHGSRLHREQSGAFGSAAYAREELVAEMASAFTCASLTIRPTVRHADYVSSWLAVLREDEKAIFRAASAASKAADYLLGFVSDEEAGQ